jgi:hypothetical protein
MVTFTTSAMDAATEEMLKATLLALVKMLESGEYSQAIVDVINSPTWSVEADNPNLQALVELAQSVLVPGAGIYFGLTYILERLKVKVSFVCLCEPLHLFLTSTSNMRTGSWLDYCFFLRQEHD